MGIPWQDQPAWEVIEQAEAALNEPLAHLLTTASEEDLSRTRNAQLAVLLTSLVAWEAASPELPDPVAFAGHSLGQLTALIASGVFTLEDGVRFAAARAEATQAAADAHPGKMAALIGTTSELASELCANEDCWVANDNTPGQIVIAGTPQGIETIAQRATEHGVKKVIPLDVNGAFHTPLMQPATDTLNTFLKSIALHTPSIPVICNLDAQPHTDSQTWRTHSAEHVSTPVRWRESMITLQEIGATSFIEVGYGTMLAGLAKRGAPEIAMFNIGNPADIASTMEAA